MYNNDVGFELYSEATKLDSISGVFSLKEMKQYGSGGSNAEGIAKALKSLGYSDRTFAITSDTNTAVIWTLNHGPCLILMPWSNCFKVDEKGYIHPDGKSGGHAVCARGVFRNAEGQKGPNRWLIRNMGWLGHQGRAQAGPRRDQQDQAHLRLRGRGLMSDLWTPSGFQESPADGKT